MSGFHVGQYACLGKLEVNVGLFPLNCPAWDVLNLDVLWPGVNETVRGENLALPRLTGTRGYPRRLDEAQHNLILWVRGDVNQAGVPNSDPWQGLFNNLGTLRSNVFAPIDSGDGTRPVTLTTPDGLSTLTADCQFEPLRPQGEIEDPNEAIYTFTMAIPAGRFV